MNFVHDFLVRLYLINSTAIEVDGRTLISLRRSLARSTSDLIHLRFAKIQIISINYESAAIIQIR